jgi:mannose-1-phosphate guanylyltransferase
MKAVILAGGMGTRLWPMSRQSRPKQFFDVVGQEPLIRDTYHRLKKWYPEEKIYFAISPAYETLLREHFPDVPDSHIIIEPAKRDTGPAMGYAAAVLEIEDPDEPIVFIPSDHFIKDEELFLKCLETGDELIRKTGKLLDIAIDPEFPSTVLGYTKIGKKYQEENGIEVYHFEGHKEKPSYEVAKVYVADGSYLWHANYYMWTPRKFMEAFEKFAPEMGETLRLIQTAIKTDQGKENLEALYNELEKISFDYAVTEKMDPEEVFIIKGEFGWSDIGAWDTLFTCLSEDGYQNVCKGKCTMMDTTGSLVYGPEEKMIAVIGVDNVVVVDTGDALLVCHRDRAQQVKDVVTHLQEKGLTTYL